MMQSSEVPPGGGGGCGAKLKQSREASGLSVADVSARLKMPVKVVSALESEDWSLLGAPVFVRGQLRSYARLVGIDIEPELANSDLGAVVPVELVSHSHTPRYQRVFEQLTRRAIYVVVTAAIAVPVWQATSPHLSNKLVVESLDLPATQPTTASAAPRARTPLIASMASIAPATAPALLLEFADESWLQVFAPDGRSVEQGLIVAGERRSYAAGDVGRVVLGNSTAVQVRANGDAVSLEPFSRANVARFTLSSDGSLAPVLD